MAAILDHLRAVREAETLFESEWYARFTRSLFPSGMQHELDLVGEETRRNIEDIDRGLREWRLSEPSSAQRGEGQHLPPLARENALVALREIKESAAHTLFRVSNELEDPYAREEVRRIASTLDDHARRITSVLGEIAASTRPSNPSPE